MLLHLGPDDLIGGIHQFVLNGKSFSQDPDVGRDPSLGEHITVFTIAPVFPYFIVHQCQAGIDPFLGIRMQVPCLSGIVSVHSESG